MVDINFTLITKLKKVWVVDKRKSSNAENVINKGEDKEWGGRKGEGEGNAGRKNTDISRITGEGMTKMG